MGIKRTTEDFIALANKKHNNKYKYIGKYVEAHSKIEIECPDHGIFEQEANAHLQGQGCPICGIKKAANTKSKDKDQFIIDANLIHNNKYKYPDEYVRSAICINIECPKHGLFKQTPNSHLSGKGCPKCADEYTSSILRKDHETFVKEANEVHCNKYKYLETYIGRQIKIKIECSKHGIFEQAPHHHLEGAGCPKCSKFCRKDHDYFVKLANSIHNNKYKYVGQYVHIKIYVEIECPNHGIFKQIPDLHLRGSGCPKCGRINISKSEIKWLDSINVPEEFRHKTIIINDKKFNVDGFDPINNTIYEFYGDFWHGNPNIFKSDDMNLVVKKTFAELYKNTMERECIIKSAGYNIVFIWENDWKKLNGKNKFKKNIGAS